MGEIACCLAIFAIDPPESPVKSTILLAARRGNELRQRGRKVARPGREASERER
jgi:hypothetical protein